MSVTLANASISVPLSAAWQNRILACSALSLPELDLRTDLRTERRRFANAGSICIGAPDRVATHTRASELLSTRRKVRAEVSVLFDAKFVGQAPDRQLHVVVRDDCVFADRSLEPAPFHQPFWEIPFPLHLGRIHCFAIVQFVA